MILNTTDEIMGALERGDLSKDFAMKFRELLQSCTEHDGSGTLTLKLKVSAKDEMVSIKSALSTVLPQRERRSSSFFVTGDGRLSMQHPNQVDMGFAEQRRRDPPTIDAGNVEIRDR